LNPVVIIISLALIFLKDNLDFMRHTLRKLMTVVAFVMALGAVSTVSDSWCPPAEAAYGVKDALSTIGIATGIGSVIGLSTIAFYDSPTSHLNNVLVGAGAGLIVGLGVAAYYMATAPETDDIDPEELLVPKKRIDPSKKPDAGNTDIKNNSSLPMPRLRQNASLAALVPSTFAARPTQPGWAVTLRVLELRF